MSLKAEVVQKLTYLSVVYDKKFFAKKIAKKSDNRKLALQIYRKLLFQEGLGGAF